MGTVYNAEMAEARLRSLMDSLEEISRISRASQRARLLDKIAEAAGDAIYEWEEDHCLVEAEDGTICGNSLDDGEGFDGKCGPHADEAEARGDYAHHDAP